MSRTGGESLASAFAGFERAAVKLERRHGALQKQVQRLESQLLDAHRQLEAVVDVLDTGVAVLSSDSTVLRANRAFSRMRLEPRRDPDVARMGGGDSTRAATARLSRRTPDGERDLVVKVVPVGDEKGTRVLAVQDTTEIRREEEVGGRHRRLEALGRMAAELAHEVRNPLGSIRLFAGMLHDDLKDRTRQREMAEQILTASSSLEATVSNLLAFASPSATTPRSIDLRALVVDVCEFLAPACALRDVRLEEPEPGECMAHVDPEGMRQVLLNLLGNALAATPRGGRISVQTFSLEDRVVLSVEDSGRGISADDLPRVFDPFFSRTDGGTGLGLSVVHRTVERHEGRVWLDSEPDRGTRVRIELPLVRRSEETES